MIFVTVGTQLPFDRLISLVDRAAPSIPEPIVAQVGESPYTPVNITELRALTPVSFEQHLMDASLVVAHAGIGTVLMAQKHGKPLILFPRIAALGEHRNDHQLATAEALKDRPGIYVAASDEALVALLGQTLAPPPPRGARPSLDRLTRTIAKFIADSPRRR